MAVAVTFMCLCIVSAASGVMAAESRVGDFVSGAVKCRNETPTETTSLAAVEDRGRNYRLTCSIECFSRHWCRGFNVRRATEQCELFDTKATTVHCDDSDSIYFEDAGVLNCARGLAVLNGADVKSVVSHQEQADITCNDGHSSAIHSVVCDDGRFIVGETPVDHVTCFKDCDDLTVPKGVNVPSGRPNGALVDVSCNVGYRHKRMNITCQNGHWQTADGVAVDNETDLCTSDCDGLVVVNGTGEATEAVNGTTIGVSCDGGLSSYYANSTCINGVFRPSRVVCGNYPRSGPYEFPMVVYQGSFYQARPNVGTARRWDSAGSHCATVGGIMATVLSADILTKITPNMPENSAIDFPIGLRQKWNQATCDGGWEWLNSGTDAVNDIDSAETVRPPWGSGWPKDRDWYEDNESNYGVIESYCGVLYGVADAKIMHSYQALVLCQILYEFYEFTPVSVGRRISFPHESSVTAANLDACTSSCIHNAFCRAVSYAPSLSECHHHSLPPSDSASILLTDTPYTIYA